MNTISNIGVHHAGGLGTDNFASTQKLTVAQINQGHYLRWPDFPSDIKGPGGNPYYVGYNIVLLPDGSYVQCRLIGAETAAQVGHNFDTVSICVVGNFMRRANGLCVDVMPTAQIQGLQKLMQGILNQDWSGLGLRVLVGTKFNLSVSRIYPHRILQPDHTDCYGTFLSDDWARKLAMVQPAPTPDQPVDPRPIVTPEDVSNLLSWQQQIQVLIMKIQDLFAKKRFARQLTSSNLGTRWTSPKAWGRSCENLPVDIVNN